LIEGEDSGDQLTDDELLAMIFLLLVAGHETTTHLLSVGLLTLLQHPDQTAQLSADWSLAQGAVDEVLRYTSPVQMSKPRFAAEDMELHGKAI
jgi:cytochrome P450